MQLQHLNVELGRLLAILTAIGMKIEKSTINHLQHSQNQNVKNIQKITWFESVV